MSMTYTVRLRHPLFRETLELQRTPIYLRFVMTTKCGRTKWDALDQLHDSPREGEIIYAAERDDPTSIHIDKDENGKVQGYWVSVFNYNLLDEQPDKDILRDNTKWREFASNMFEKNKEKFVD